MFEETSYTKELKLIFQDVHSVSIQKKTNASILSQVWITQNNCIMGRNNWNMCKPLSTSSMEAAVRMLAHLTLESCCVFCSPPSIFSFGFLSTLPAPVKAGEFLAHQCIKLWKWDGNKIIGFHHMCQGWGGERQLNLRSFIWDIHGGDSRVLIAPFKLLIKYWDTVPVLEGD